jgi:hypothetical protein
MYDLPCAVCGRLPKIGEGSDPSHTKKTRGAGGDPDEPDFPLCREHHTEEHKIGRLSWARKYLPWADPEQVLVDLRDFYEIKWQEYKRRI